MSLETKVAWNEFSMRYSITTILKAKRSPLSFLHTELDVGESKIESKIELDKMGPLC